MRAAEGQRSIPGHVMSTAGIDSDPLKTAKINSVPTPTDVTRVRCFLGQASYYCRFVPSFTVIAAPLNRITKKDTEFEWTEACEEPFENLECALVSAPVLVYTC